MIKRVNLTANEVIYTYFIWGIAVFGAATVFIALDGRWLALAFFVIYFMLFVGLVFASNEKRKKASSASTDDQDYFNGLLYSYSRSQLHTIADVIMKTVELSFFAVLLDLAAKGITLEEFLKVIGSGSVSETLPQSSWKPITSLIVIIVQAMLYALLMVFFYRHAAAAERDADRKQVEMEIQQKQVISTYEEEIMRLQKEMEKLVKRCNGLEKKMEKL